MIHPQQLSSSRLYAFWGQRIEPRSRTPNTAQNTTHIRSTVDGGRREKLRELKAEQLGGSLLTRRAGAHPRPLAFCSFLTCVRKCTHGRAGRLRAQNFVEGIPCVHAQASAFFHTRSNVISSVVEFQRGNSIRCRCMMPDARIVCGPQKSRGQRTLSVVRILASKVMREPPG